MRTRMTVPALMLLAALSACGRDTPENDPVTVCQEQSAMAEAGRVDGRQIIITCPSA